MARKRYLSDLTDQRWEEIRELIPATEPGGRPRDTDVREIINAIFYLNRAGCPWRMLPIDFPPWQTVYTYFRDWRLSGVWKKNQRRLKEAFEKTRRKRVSSYGWDHRQPECEDFFERRNQGIRWWQEDQWPQALKLMTSLNPI